MRDGLRALVVGGLVAAMGVPLSAATPKPKVAVAVLNFDYGTVSNWWGTYDIGAGVADQLVDALVNDGTLRVIERKQLQSVLAEQGLANSKRADPTAAQLSKLGKVLGVRYVVAGAITKCATEIRNYGGRIGGVGAGMGKARTEVALTGRLVDTTTGEIVVSAKATGVSTKKAVGGSKGRTAVSIGSSNEFHASALGDAQEKAANELAKALLAQAERLR